MSQIRERDGSLGTVLVAAAALVAFAAGGAVAARDRQPQEASDQPSVATDASAPDPVRNPDEFDAVGEAMTARLCYTDCHKSDRVFSIRRTAGEWDLLIRDMTGRGVVGTRDQIALVRRYLTWSFGRVSVNAAPAAELAAVLGISTNDADAIVAYRDAHGRFADLEALLKVPGLAPATIEAQVYALDFD